MNLIDAKVTKVISRRQFVQPEDYSNRGKVYDIFFVEYVDMGGKGQKELWFDADKNVDIQEGYVFKH